MSTAERTHVPGDTPTHDNLPAVRPVIIQADPVSVGTRRPRLRTVTSGTPIVGNVTAAPAGQSLIDRALRRVLVEGVRCGLWLVSVPAVVAINAALAMRWTGGLLWRRRQRCEVDRLAVVCGECGTATARTPDGTAPAGWFHRVTRDVYLCPACRSLAAAATRPFWNGGGHR